MAVLAIRRQRTRTEPVPAENPTESPTGSPDPANGDDPIQHVIFLVKENRSFDHYFGTYPGAEGATEGGTIADCGASRFEDGPVVP